MQHIASLIQSALDSDGPGAESGTDFAYRVQAQVEHDKLPRAIPRPRTKTLTDLFPRCWAPFEGTDAERQANSASKATVELYRQWAQAESTARRLGYPPGGIPGSYAAREIAILAAAYEAEWMVHNTVPVVKRVSL